MPAWRTGSRCWCSGREAAVGVFGARLDAEQHLALHDEVRKVEEQRERRVQRSLRAAPACEQPAVLWSVGLDREVPGCLERESPAGIERDDLIPGLRIQQQRVALRALL